jgi:hypothetical protein
MLHVRYTLFVMLLLRGCSSPAFAEDPAAPTQAKHVYGVIVTDGDSVSGHLDLGWNINLGRVSILAYDFDCYEASKVRHTVEVTDEEVIKGKAAKYALIDLLDGAELYAEDSQERDPHGRLSAILWVRKDGQWIYLAKFMDEHGHLRVPRKK